VVQSGLRRILIFYHRPRPFSSPVKHTSFAAPHKPSFGYYAQYGATSAGRTAKGSTTVSTNFISSTHEGMTTLANKLDTDSNTRMIELIALRTPMTFHATSEQDLNPRTSTVNDHPAVLTHEMMVIEPGEKSMHMFTWKVSCTCLLTVF
jgi:hypothetical protein